MSWYKNKYGKASTMRIILMIGAITGASAVAVGCIVVVAAVVAVYMRIPEATQIAMQGVALSGIGGGMIGFGEFAKFQQAKGE